MNAKEEMTKLIMASYDQGVKDAQQEALATLEQLIADVRADEREACAKVCDNHQYVHPYHDLGTLIRARGEA
jgi:uncharacterized protein YdhG (YjbR/CyaY superfamily)